jgi:tetratricopeptide (TPR) repeat protein
MRAAERALEQTAYDEAARLYDVCLQALELVPGEPHRRAELWLQAGEAQRLAGRWGDARGMFRRAVDLARELQARELFARGALGMQSEEETGLLDEERTALLQEALGLLPPGDSPVRVRLLSKLSKALYFTASESRCVELASQAVDMARRIGDAESITIALNDQLLAMQRPHRLLELEEIGRELKQRASALDERELLAHLCHWRIGRCLETGDRSGLEAAVEEHAALAHKLRQPFFLWYVKEHQAMLALLSGSFADAERWIEAALREGQSVQPDVALQWSSVQLYILRREQGRLAELESALRDIAERFPNSAGWGAATALFEVELGRRERAQHILRHLVSEDLSAVRSDVLYLITLAVLAEVARELADRRSASLLYPALLPHADRHIAVGLSTAGYGSVSRYLGLLAGVLGELDLAAAHFDKAIRSDDAFGAHPFVARERYEYAALLLERSGHGDREQAAELLAQARTAAQKLDMPRLLSQVGTLQRKLGGPNSWRPKR